MHTNGGIPKLFFVKIGSKRVETMQTIKKFLLNWTRCQWRKERKKWKMRIFGRNGGKKTEPKKNQIPGIFTKVCKKSGKEKRKLHRQFCGVWETCLHRGGWGALPKQNSCRVSTVSIFFPFDRIFPHFPPHFPVFSLNFPGSRNFQKKSHFWRFWAKKCVEKAPKIKKSKIF